MPSDPVRRLPALDEIIRTRWAWFPVGAIEVAQLLDVQRQTVHAWRHRDQIPAPDFTISGRPVWWAYTIIEWGVETGRLAGDLDEALSSPRLQTIRAHVVHHGFAEGE